MRTRYGRIGVFTSIALMISIILFAGSMFWLLVETSMLSSNSNSHLFKPASENEVNINSVEQTIFDLDKKGVILYNYTKSIDKEYYNTTYSEFILEATKVGIVYKGTMSNGSDFFLIEKSDKNIKWFPVQ